MLKAYLGISSGAPKGCTFVHDGGELILEAPAELDAGAVSEIMKWLGASTTGNSPIRVLEPEAFKEAVAIPHQSGGNQRWKCPRCDRDVMQGVNDSGTITGGLCKDCWAVDMRLAGQPVQQAATSSNPAQRAAPSPPAAPSSPAVAAIAALQPKPPAPAPSASSSAPEPVAYELVPVVASARDLPPADKYRFAIWGHRLCYSDGAHWRWLEGFVPSLE